MLKLSQLDVADGWLSHKPHWLVCVNYIMVSELNQCVVTSYLAGVLTAVTGVKCWCNGLSSCIILSSGYYAFFILIFSFNFRPKFEFYLSSDYSCIFYIGSFILFFNQKFEWPSLMKTLVVSANCSTVNELYGDVRPRILPNAIQGARLM